MKQPQPDVCIAVTRIMDECEGCRADLASRDDALAFLRKMIGWTSVPRYEAPHRLRLDARTQRLSGAFLRLPFASPYSEQFIRHFASTSNGAKGCFPNDALSVVYHPRREVMTAPRVSEGTMPLGFFTRW